MGKRYYCDYCDRSFQDTLHNRKKHLNGVQHHRAKKAWFDHFRDAASILQDERTKQPCRKYLQTGQCVFGPNCRYSHMSERDMKFLEQQIEDERWQKVNSNQRKSFTEPSIDEWLLRREKKAVFQNWKRKPELSVMFHSFYCRFQISLHHSYLCNLEHREALDKCRPTVPVC